MHLFLASNISDVAKDIAQRANSVTKNKKLIFIPTAAEPETGSKSWLSKDRQALVAAGYEVTDFSLTNQTPSQVEAALAGAGTICVGGGNNYYLMKQVRQSGFDKIIKNLLIEGIIYLGSSAGSMIAGPDFENVLDDRQIVPAMTDFSGLNLTDVVIWPHWGSANFAQSYQEEIKHIQASPLKQILLTNQQYLHVKDDWYQIVTVS